MCWLYSVCNSIWQPYTTVYSLGLGLGLTTGSDSPYTRMRQRDPYTYMTTGSGSRYRNRIRGSDSRIPYRELTTGSADLIHGIRQPDPIHRIRILLIGSHTVNWQPDPRIQQPDPTTGSNNRIWPYFTVYDNRISRYTTTVFHGIRQPCISRYTTTVFHGIRQPYFVFRISRYTTTVSDNRIRQPYNRIWQPYII